MGVKSTDPVETTVLKPFARNNRRSEDPGAAQKCRAPRARPGPPSSHCGSSSNKSWTTVSASTFAPLRRGNHRLSWRKEKRTQMGSASSNQRTRCLLREESEDALLLKEQCAFDEKSNERFSGAPCCLGCHHAQLGTKWDSRQRLWLQVVGRARTLLARSRVLNGHHGGRSSWADDGSRADSAQKAVGGKRPEKSTSPSSRSPTGSGCVTHAESCSEQQLFLAHDRPWNFWPNRWVEQTRCTTTSDQLHVSAVALHQLSTRKRTLIGATDVLVRR